ncbi:hypothetical protein HRI_002708900 [Hibiscus trionum]|uniref:Uncharacterized protein n=1 Tax=Hibiscus trionum TaxID=183268 RepID=A0A9W7M7J7_HIBTR|nr:hypothetical protein HRI_002708900 [Hibiscus trionum]
MELLLLLVEIIATAVLLGLAGMFIRLFDALVLTPKRIRSRLGIQAIAENAPPSSLLGNFQPRNNTKFKGKQVHRICFHRVEYRYCRGSIRIRPKMGTTSEQRL